MILRQASSSHTNKVNKNVVKPRFSQWKSDTFLLTITIRNNVLDYLDAFVNFMFWLPVVIFLVFGVVYLTIWHWVYLVNFWRNLTWDLVSHFWLDYYFYFLQPFTTYANIMDESFFASLGIMDYFCVSIQCSWLSLSVQNCRNLMLEYL